MKFESNYENCTNFECSKLVQFQFKTIPCLFLNIFSYYRFAYIKYCYRRYSVKANVDIRPLARIT